MLVECREWMFVVPLTPLKSIQFPCPHNLGGRGCVQQNIREEKGSEINPKSRCIGGILAICCHFLLFFTSAAPRAPHYPATKAVDVETPSAWHIQLPQVPHPRPSPRTQAVVDHRARGPPKLSRQSRRVPRSRPHPSIGAKKGNLVG